MVRGSLRPNGKTWLAALAAGAAMCILWMARVSQGASVTTPVGGEVGTATDRDIETVRFEDVAPADRRGESPPSAASTPNTAGEEEGASVIDRAQLAAFGEQLQQIWASVPAHSPVNGVSRLTSGFGWRMGPVSRRREFHGGVDLAAPAGTPVVAPADGVVEDVFFDDASGRVVVLDHGNSVRTLYGHLSSVLVAPADVVRRGAIIGRLGSTGWRSTGPHLHYAVRLAGKYVDPERFLFAARRQARGAR